MLNLGSIFNNKNIILIFGTNIEILVLIVHDNSIKLDIRKFQLNKLYFV